MKSIPLVSGRKSIDGKCPSEYEFQNNQHNSLENVWRGVFQLGHLILFRFREKTMSQQPTIETERLILRPFELSDAKNVKRLAGDKAIASTTLNIPHPYEDGMAEKWIAKHQELFDAGQAVHFAITTKSNGKLVGAISLMDISERHSRADMGYWIGKSC
jgi:hypothetical protein